MEASNSADQKQNPNFLVEVNSIEKQLWTLIHSKGILHPDVSELYVKAGLTYEQIFKSNLQQEELQEVEFCLWKLHYKHIDEFRKGFKTDDHVKHMKAFKLFLLRAAEFYQNLISKVRGYYYRRLSEESGEQKSRFLCHRFYICLGDLQRYKEQYLKTHEHPNWSTAATYYLEAAKSRPDSGNPHNQLAVLATYVGDEFLALYHCVRSLAVKEPFPGASNNLLLLFEKNRSSPVKSLSTDAQFNFFNPSERNVSVENVREDRNLTAGIDLWPLVVRTTSFFFLKSRFDEFGCAFASTMRELDAAFAADDRNLEAMLESYQFMDMARKGPYRILHLVAVFIFIFHNLAEFNGSDKAKEEVKLTNLAFTMVFIVMGRVVERCLKMSPLDSCPLLPALLAFLDYLPFLLHKAEEEESRFDEKSEIAISYFFGKLVEFLNRLGENCSAKMLVALWEDHELKSLAPLAPIHVLLDFSSHMDLRESFDRGKELRLQRIINSAIEITSRQKKSSQKWLFFDKQRTRFYTTSGELQCKEELFHGNGEGSNKKCVTIGPVEFVPFENERSVPAEEEEVILLKPLVRCQSAPIYSSGIDTRPLSSDSTTSGKQTTTSDESLRRTSSLVMNHIPHETNSEGFSFMQGLKDTDPQHLHLEEGTVSGRPPSLSSWVVDKNKENGRIGLSKPKGLSPIDEAGPVTSFDSLSITEHPASSYSPPTPSAPLLPEDASWFHNGASTNKAESFYDQTRYMELPSLTKPYTNPPFAGISSSEWLRRYRASQNLGPAYSYQDQGTNNLRNFLAHGSSKFSLLARYGTPNQQPMISSENSTFHHQLYMEDHESRGEKLSNGQQSTTNAYGFSDDPGPFLRYLREKEWLNENSQRSRGPSPTYMNN
ncbi:Nonsense-mediated mRNA decay factor SMG7-like [Cardamine amara subsp. amara]|uniref:Nonsense-mediated mRNA decay factor SMG7-like n=1 Tax=Cardamine amara subsp. amara TaxID=228776 RepID=A0ABD1BNP9_CARAN